MLPRTRYFRHNLAKAEGAGHGHLSIYPAARQDIQEIAARCFDAMEITREIDDDVGSIARGSS